MLEILKVGGWVCSILIRTYIALMYLDNANLLKDSEIGVIREEEDTLIESLWE